MKLLLRINLFFALLLFINSFSKTSLASDLPTSNLATSAEADLFAKNLVRKTREEAKELGISIKEVDPFYIYHIGNSIPKQLRWILIHLEAAHIPFKLELITEAEFKAQSSQIKEILKLEYDGGLKQTEESEAISKAGLFLRKMFGTPEGLTAWLRFKQLFDLRPAHATLATASALVAGPLIAFTFYLDPKAGSMELAPIRAGIAWAAMTWVYIYNGPYFNEIMSQMKTVKKDIYGKVVATDSRTGTIISNTVRSSFFNAAVIVATYGLDSLFSSFRFFASAQNTIIHLFARLPIDDLIAKKKPTLNDDGSVDSSKGRWSLKKWIVIDLLTTISFSIPKIMHLLNVAPWSNNLYYAMGTLGLIKVLVHERHNILEKIKQIHIPFKGYEVEYCSTILSRKTPLQPL
jgi:hypothetical protein